MLDTDPRNGNWFFRTVIQKPDGTKERIRGTPGAPGGPYHDLPNSQAGAKEAERRAVSYVLQGKSLADREPDSATTIAEHAVSFLDLYMPGSKPSARRDRKVCVKRLLPTFGDLSAASWAAKSNAPAAQRLIDAFAKSELKRGMAIKTINNTLACFSTLLTYALGEKPKLKFHVDGKRPKIHAVDPADVERLLGACNDDRYRVVILLGSEAGLRAGEIRGLQWDDLKDQQLTVQRALDEATNVVQSPKHDKERNVPLSPRLIETLATLPRRGRWIVSRNAGGEYIYGNALRSAIKAIYDSANVKRPRMPLHCLRHTFGTVMARKVQLPVLKELMGHEDIQTTMKYVDMNEKDKRDAIALVFGERAPAGNNDDVVK